MSALPVPGFRRLWAAYAVSTYGTWIAFGAFPLIAVRVLHASPFAVSLLEAAGLAVAAVAALPLGPWVERRPKRPVLIAADLVRFLATASIPLTYALGLLTYPQLLLAATVSGTANIAFTAASGAYLRTLVPGDRLLAAHGRFEGTSWVATAVGPPLGGALTALFGPVVTVLADAVSYLLSALGLAGIRAADPPAPARSRVHLLTGWRTLRHDRFLRRLFLNSVLVSGLITATVPLLAVLLLGTYHFPPWQYGLAFGVPALGGLAGARLSAPLVRHYGHHRVRTVSGRLRSLFPLGLAFLGPGTSGLLTVIVVEALLITCMGVYNPLYATERLRRTPADRTAQVLTTWTVAGRLTQAALTALWGLLATATTPLTAITLAGVLLLGTPLLLPRRDHEQPVAG
ncbi:MULTISPECIES: MFS transporter [Streptomyces]|uniref:MFS family permease n=2 Tax=Streptomyces TaxID=1883 RepID=A0ABT9LE81_STRGD|nr:MULTISPECIES: MFS transporter [Streptomyces]MDP9681560.1 MFS family permease [Streptomyces griseoviridis]GGS73685.1 MFS transporter [Streptomyces griseoviridis]GGU43984.1 MFS transporter [Streptomyces daghestanicus]GHI34445.1 MFS transporter [Streptomyces daghestanicus]